MKRSLLPIFLASLLAGCFDNGESSNSDDSSATKPEPPAVLPSTPLDPPTLAPSPDLTPSEAIYQAKLFVGNKLITGDVSCDGDGVGTTGNFTIPKDQKSIDCSFGVVDLGRFSVIPPALGRNGEQSNADFLHFNLNDVLDALGGNHSVNAFNLLSKINTCATESKRICLDEGNSFDILGLYKSEDQALIDEFLNAPPPPKPDIVDEGELPSAHVDPDFVPAVTPGTSNDLTGTFVSANAEAAYEYVPSIESRPLTRSKLTNEDGLALAGIEFFSQSAHGITDMNGEFEFLWGENLIFGINTFTLGEVKGNKLEYKLSDLSSNELVQQNIETLVKRYGLERANSVTITDKVRSVFAQYPNVINELINLNLPNGATIEGTEFVTPNEFDNQFTQGLTQLIDNQLKQTGSWRWQPAQRTLRARSGNYVTESLQGIFKDVEQFHIFHDNFSWYTTGFPRAMRNFNLSNLAFPVLMPRSDNNHWQKYGEEASWTRGSGSDQKAYIVDATTIEADSDVTMVRPPLISNETAIYNLPTIAAGMIGTGKVVFLGNAMYTSVLSCPDNYWASRDLGIEPENSQCRYQTPHNPDAQAGDPRNDQGSMKTFFSNLLTWLVPEYENGAQSIGVGSNIEKGHAFRFDGGSTEGQIYDFFVNKGFGLDSLTHLTGGGFAGLDASSTSVLLLQSFEIKIQNKDEDYDTNAVVSDVSKPKLTEDDVTHLIRYVNDGGNIIFFDALKTQNPAPIARLADAAGVSIGGGNQARLMQTNCGGSIWCWGGVAPNLHAVDQHDIVVYERYADTSKIIINDDGTVTWPGAVDMPKLEIPTYEFVNPDNTKATRYAFHIVQTEAEKQAKIAELEQYFRGVPVCKDSYQYEVNCIEVRAGHGIPVHNDRRRPEFTRYEISPEIVGGMVQAANLGDNINKLLNHEVYYRSKGSHGVRLSSAELTSTYDNLSIWLWNNEPYAYVEDSEAGDELGFKRAVEMLNCYTNDYHGGNSGCQPGTRELLMQWQMLTADGELNPSYPLNWMEKPLTRMMLGRSFWDLDISVLTTGYPGRPQATGSSGSAEIHTINHAVIGTAGAMQSTGLWAPQRSSVTVSGGVAATITVALVDDLTGRAQHELALNRPPRVQQSFSHDGSSTTFKVPYGGLIYIQPLEQASEDRVKFNFTGVLKASLWKGGEWVNPVNQGVPLAEIDTGHFIYTTPVENVTGTDINQFVEEMNLFADQASNFYGRDETTESGDHRRFTYEGLPGNRHRFVNDIQISIGAAHSGYPVQNSFFNKQQNRVPTNPTDDWLLWHEVGHNLAAAPFSITGGTEVTNNILALYMQEQRVDRPQMDRIDSDLQKVEMWLGRHNGHGWSEGNNNMRLAMFGQLKLWAAEHFDISQWYPQGEQPTVFGDDQGWNMFKLAHRKTRGDKVGDDLNGRNGTNYCSASDTGLSQGDLLMSCLSYLSGYDLSDYFRQWNPSESRADLPDGTADYTGGLTEAGYARVTEMGLSRPEKSPLTYTSIRR